MKSAHFFKNVENIEDLEKAVIELLHDKAKRQDIVKRNYKYWLDTYESNVVKNKYIAAIENASLLALVLVFLYIQQTYHA